MSRIARLLPLYAVAAICLPAARAAGQRATAGVALSATVLPYATAERVSSATIRHDGITTEYRVTVVVRANTPFRVIARRTRPAGRAITLGIGEHTVRLETDRAAVQVARGNAGVATFDVTYVRDIEESAESDAPPIRFEVLADPIDR